MIDKELLEILACPACLGEVAEHEGAIVCLKCHRSYPIKNGIPVMLIEDADHEEHTRHSRP